MSDGSATNPPADQRGPQISGGAVYGATTGTNTGSISSTYNINPTVLGSLSPITIDPAQIAAAQQWLAQLPTADPPAPADLPIGSRMPLTRNPHFVGRVDDLRDLAVAVRDRSATVGIVAATGMGGVGKSQLACEFVHRYGQYFAGGVFWLSFADPGGVKAEIAACGGPGALALYAERDHLSLDEQVDRVRAAWNSPMPRLLIFDNCEDETLLADWRPTSGGCRVLLTSRRATWDDTLGVQRQHVGTLRRPESVALLRKFRADLPADDPPLDALADWLGDLPLALHLAGSFLKLYRADITPAEYLDELRGTIALDHDSFVGSGVSPTQHDLDLSRTIRVSYARLDPADPADALAIRLLQHAAYFAPGEPLPRWLLCRALALPADKATQRKATRALDRLLDLGLIDSEADDALRVHRLIAAFARAIASGDDMRAAVETTMAEVASEFNSRGIPTPLLAIQAHLRFITDSAIDAETRTTARLCNELAEHLNMIADYASARRYVDRALSIQEHLLGEQHPDTARSLNDLAVLLNVSGNYAEAFATMQRALHIREQVLGPQHPDTAYTLNNIGMLLQHQGNLAGARPYYERALAIYEQVRGADHPDTAWSLDNLGGVLQQQAAYAEAQQKLERALTIRRQTLGEEHTDTANSLSNLGGLRQAQGDLAGAKAYYERALTIMEHVLGPKHPDTATSLTNLGRLLQAQRDYTGAQSYYQRALAIYEQSVGPRHPSTATGLNDLGAVLQAQGDYAGAQACYERALSIQQQVLGMQHRDTALSLEWLGYLLQAQGDYAGARPYYEQALAILQQAVGDQHQDTIRVRDSLATVIDQIDAPGDAP